MKSLQEMNRVLYQHTWKSAQEWASAIHTLGELDDEAIAELIRLGQGNPLPAEA